MLGSAPLVAFVATARPDEARAFYVDVLGLELSGIRGTPPAGGQVGPVPAGSETYLRIVGPTFGLFGLGLALYFAAQGAGQLTLPLLAGFGRLVLAVGGGWLAIFWLQAGLPWLFAAVGVAFVAFGLVQALAVKWVIRARVSRPV